MDEKLRQTQKKVLRIFAERAKNFALAGGTALEMYYLKHRFSVDLDFFSVIYNVKEIEQIVDALHVKLNRPIKMESELLIDGKAKVQFYTLSIKGSKRPLKIDFVEDVFVSQPKIHLFNKVPVYSAEDIYFQKICAISGTQTQKDEMGRYMSQGRNEARDIFDLFMLSSKIKPLHLYLKGLPAHFQRRMIHWYRTFSRQELQLNMMDLEIYDKSFNSRVMIKYLEDEIKKFMSEVMDI